ncbi:hypothetical protein TNCV_2804351 [Trichonephila clavipes]|nr:hypothetical protein TNCV_2804351 [Trichonephila clavipes]
MSKIVLRNLIISSKYYEIRKRQKKLEVNFERLNETEQRQKLEQQEQLSIEKLRLEMELSRIANQSANQNNGVNGRDRKLKMERSLLELIWYSKVIPRKKAIEDKLSKLVKTSISVMEVSPCLIADSGTEITVIKKDLVPGI